MATRTRTVEYALPQSIAAITSGTSIVATACAAGVVYQILTVGTTNWTAIGASANTVGVIFTASGAGTGTGTCEAIRVFTTKTVDIAESSSRVIRSATMEVAAIDGAAAAASISGVTLETGIDAVAVNRQTVTFTLTNSGENQGWLFSFDVTSYFNTNFTSTSHTILANLIIRGIGSINAYAKLIITYDFDDASATTRTKTVKIPMDGNTGNLTTSFVNLGGVASQIPALDSFLPEASKTYKSIFFEMNTHTGTSAAATNALSMSYDGGTTTIADTSWGNTLNSDIAYRRIDDLTATLTTSAAQSIQAKCTSTTGGPNPCLNGVLVVTYTYDHSSSTGIINSLQMTCLDEAAWMGGTATGDKSRFVKEVMLEEPGTLALVQSAILVSYNASGGPVVDHRVGSQGSRTFTHGSTAHCGGMTHMRRIDAGESGGTAGFTIARGLNQIVFDLFATSATAGNIPSNASALLYLNYTSDKHTSGDGVHNATRHWMNRPYATGGAVQRLQSTTAITPIIQETEYYINGVSYQIIFQTMTTTPNPGGFALQCECQSGEAEGAGWHDLYSSLYESDAEMGFSLSFARGRTDFLRWPADWDTGSRLNVETARDYRFDCQVTGVGVFQAAMLLTYHAVTFAIAASVTGSAGGTVTIIAHRGDTGEKIGSTSRTGNGSYSITWYDNTIDVFSEVWESSTLVGRSDNGPAA